MFAPAPLGPFNTDFYLYTSDVSFYRPTGWRRAGGQLISTELFTGDAGEARSADGTLVIEPLPGGDHQDSAHYARFRISARHTFPIKAVKFALDLPYMKMLAPEEVELEEATWRQWDFPAFWRTGFAIWQAKTGYFTLATQDYPWRFKRLRALRAGERMRLEIIHDAPLRTRSFDFAPATWELGYRSEIDTLLDQHAAFVAQAFGARPFEQRKDTPDWLRRVALVVNLHGTDWNGVTNLDFGGMTAAVRTLGDLFPAEQTILYLIGWDGRYMRAYPDYRPADGLGGPEGFTALCRQARARGFHIMPHLNAMAANMCHPLYLRHLKDYVLRDGNGVGTHSFKIDWDHDGLGDPAHAYISLVPPALRDILSAAVDRLVADYEIDSVFLDETCNVFYNDPAWDQVDGVRRLVRDLHARHPDLLIAGEEWNEMLLGLTPLVQIWEETADGRKGFGREKSPLLRCWAGRFIRSCGYLALASPDGRTGVHEWPDKPWIDERANEPYYIPTLSITGATLARGLDGIGATIARARDYAARYIDARLSGAP
jgi:hypothetical protein